MEKTRIIDFGSNAEPSPTLGDTPLARQVHEFCNTWERAVKTICLYPSTNPLPDEFRTKFFDALDRLLEEVGTITLTVTDTSLSFEHCEVYTHLGNEENLAFLLFRDGVSRLVFESGIVREESDRFLNALADVYSSPNTHVDMVSRLWQEGLSHIKYHTLDRVIEGSYIDMASDDDLAVRHKQFTGEPEATQDDGTVGQLARPLYEGLQSERQQQVQSVFGDVANLSESDQKCVLAYARMESPESAERLGLEILFEILQMSDHPRIAEDTVTVLEKQLRESATTNRWSMVRAILEHWNATTPSSPTSVARLIQSARLRVADGRHFELLSHFMNDNPQCDLSEVRGVLAGFGTAALTLTISMLGVLEHRTARLMVCDFLAERGGDAIDLIGGFVYDKRWFVVRNVAKVLGEIGNERALTFLKRSAKHADVRVRVETLKALQNIKTDHSYSAMLEFLNDDDDGLRRRAVRSLGETHAPAVADALRRRVDGTTPTHQNPEELRELYTAYARTGEGHAIELLTQIARRSPLFGRRRWLPVRMAAIFALSHSPDIEARAALADIATSRQQDIARAAREGAERWSHNQVELLAEPSTEIEAEVDDAATT